MKNTNKKQETKNEMRLNVKTKKNILAKTQAKEAWGSTLVTVTRMTTAGNQTNGSQLTFWKILCESIKEPYQVFVLLKR